MGQLSIGKGKLRPGPHNFHAPKGTEKHRIVPVLHVPHTVIREKAQSRNPAAILLDVSAEQLQGVACSQENAVFLDIPFQPVGIRRQAAYGQLLVFLRHGTQVDQIHRAPHKFGFL